MAKKPAPEDRKAGPPAYMVSFADMMTLILTFFILLVSMAKERNIGLLAKGLGSFIVALRSHGMDGIMSGAEKQRVFDHMRRRFNLPPEEDPERRDDHVFASSLELLRAEALESLAPHGSIAQPGVADFEEGRSDLSEGSRAFLDRIADTLRPSYGQVLVLEGHFDPRSEAGSGGPLGRGHYLAFERADAVRAYLVDEQGFAANRVEARAWFREVEVEGTSARRVDARLITPARPKDE